MNRELKVSDVVILNNGKDYRHLNEGKFPCYGSGGIIAHVDSCIYNKPSVLIASSGSIGNVFYVDYPFWAIPTTYYTEINYEVVLPKFLFYLLTNMDLRKLNTTPGSIPSLSRNVLYNIVLPIPSLDEQKKIIGILDDANNRINSIKSNIEQMKHNYENYRDGLFGLMKKHE